MNRESQCKAIKRHLLSGNRLTSAQAIELFGCYRLAARVYDLKKSGMLIESELVRTSKNMYSVYYV